MTVCLDLEVSMVQEDLRETLDRHLLVNVVNQVLLVQLDILVRRENEVQLVLLEHPARLLK
jgi:hypothetical protein